MTQSMHVNSWKALAVAGGISGVLWAPLAFGARVYLEDGDYSPRPAQIAPLDIEFPRAVLSETAALPSTAEALSKYDGISVHPHTLSSLLLDAQRLNPNLIVLRHFTPVGAAGIGLKDPCANPFSVAFGSTGASTGGCSVFAGHWVYHAGTTLAGTIDASTLIVSVADGTRINPGSYVVIYDAPAGSFRNAEHALVKSVSGSRVTLSTRGFKSVARSHSAGAIMAEHSLAESARGANTAEHWRYNQSSTCPTDANGRTIADAMRDWLVVNYNRDGSGNVFRGRLDGILLDADVWSISYYPRVDVNNDLVPDGGWSATSDVNYWGDGLDRFYQTLRNRFPDLLVVGGYRSTRGFEHLSGTQMEGWPVSNTQYSATPEYKQIDGLLADQMVRLREVPEHFPAYTENLSKTPTRLYPNGVSPPPPSNAPFRFSLGTTLLHDGYYALQPTPLNPDPWYDEFAVDVNPKSPNYGRAVASNPQNEALTRMHGGWLGMPLGARQRVYDDASFSPDRSLIANGGLDTSAAVTGWAGSNVNIGLDPDESASGSGSLRVSTHLAYASKPSSASVKTPRVSLEAGVPYTLAFTAKAQQLRGVKVYVAGSSQAFLIPEYWVRRVVNFTASRTGTYAVNFQVGEEDIPIWIDEVYLFEGNTNVFRREFESGLVVVNATAQQRKVPLEKTYLRILGTGQDSINNGGVITSVTIEPYDAAFLVRPLPE